MEEQLQRATDFIDAQHYVNAPAHAFAMLTQLQGHVNSALKEANDDPLLFAYQLQEVLPRLAGIIIAMQKWTNAVLDAPAGVIEPHGARLCT